MGLGADQRGGALGSRALSGAVTAAMAAVLPCAGMVLRTGHP